MTRGKERAKANKPKWIFPIPRLGGLSLGILQLAVKSKDGKKWAVEVGTPGDVAPIVATEELYDSCEKAQSAAYGFAEVLLSGDLKTIQDLMEAR